VCLVPLLHSEHLYAASSYNDFHFYYRASMAISLQSGGAKKIDFHPISLFFSPRNNFSPAPRCSSRYPTWSSGVPNVFGTFGKLAVSGRLSLLATRLLWQKSLTDLRAICSPNRQSNSTWPAGTQTSLRVPCAVT
jgi:hypothetical protein